MEGRPERLADYFVVVGIGEKNITKFKQFEEEVNLPEKLLEPVTDIAVYYSKHEQEKIKGYKVIESTPGGHSADVGSLLPNRNVYICYKKGKDKPPITDIGVFHSNQNHSPPAGYETLVFSIGGRSADLNKSGRSHSYLTFKRGLIQGHNNAITDLCLISSSKGEEPPPCYKVLKSLDLCKGVVGHTLHLCYRTCQVRPPSTAYTPELLSRFPLDNHPEFPLPDSVPLFCLPFGVSVEHWERHTPFPYPTFSTFALTNAQGQCMYGSVVVFYEAVSDHPCTKEMSKALNIHEDEPLHLNKCICLLSHWPFFSAFKAFLCALYRLSLSRDANLPLERYVGNLMLEVPFPSLVRPRIQMHIGSESIVFSLPVKTPLPLSVSTHWSLLTSLDPDNCTTLLQLALLEQKIVLHSSRPALLTCVGEALRSVLFPFSWQCTYIPLCPLAFSSYMQAPVPFIIGIDSQYFDVFEKPSGVVVVDLDANSILMNKEVHEIISSHPLPAKATKVLKQSLHLLVPRVAGLDSGLDLAVEVAPIDYQHTHKYDMEVVDVEIRDVFLRFTATILGHYRNCLKPLLHAPSDRSCEASQLFNLKMFLKHCSSSDAPFFKRFFDTQIFNGFIEQRSFAQVEDTRFVFFDECTEKVKRQPSMKLVDASAKISCLADLPTVVSLPVDDYGLPTGRTYNYTTFPTVLDHSLFNPAPPPSVAHGRLSVPNVVSSSHVSSATSSPMVARRTNAEKDRDRELMGKAVKSEVLWSKCLLSHVCSLWYMLLPSLLAHHWNKMGTLVEAMDLLEDMRLNKTLPNDEVCYRVLMEQCVHLKRPALAVRVYHEMIKAGIQPNAVTYGFYNKAVLEGAWPSQRRRWKVLLIVVAVCLYLNKLSKNGKKSDKSRPRLGKILGEADFSSITVSHHEGNKNNISALDVGLDVRRQSVEFQGEDEEDGAFDYHSLRRKRRGHVYKLTSLGERPTSAGDYAVCGDSSYVATSKLPRWSEVAGARDVGRDMWSNVVISGGQSPSLPRRVGGVSSSLGGGASLDIEMTSCSQCPSCERLLYDEQIMSGWTEDDGNYKTTCNFCATQMVASLTVVTKRTLPQLSPVATPTNPGRASPGGSSLSNVSSSSHLGLGDQDFCEYSDKTWPRKSSKGKGDNSSTTTPEGSSRRDSQNMMTEGMPTHYESVGMETRGVADGIAAPQTDPLHRRSPVMAANDEVDGPVTEGKMRQHASQNLPDEFTMSDSGTGRVSSPNETNDSHRINSTAGGANHMSKGVTSNHVDSVHSSMCKSPSLDTPTVPRININQCSIDGNDGEINTPRRDTTSRRVEMAQVLKRMKALGHRRAASVPIKRPSSQLLPSRLPMPSGLLRKQLANEQDEPLRQLNQSLDVTGLKTETSPPIVVPYLSPIVLRKEVELLLLQDGMKFLEREELVRDRPIIYWNLVWYFSRLQLPTFLPLLSLWDFQHKNRELKKVSVHMTVKLLWDQTYPGIRDPLYLVWLGKLHGHESSRELHNKPEFKRRDSESLLQGLVARIQCRDWSHVIDSLLKDRIMVEETAQQAPAEGAELKKPHSRSIYREILFLLMVVSSRANVANFDREFTQHLQRLSKEMSSKLHSEDYPPTQRVAHCRQDFGCLDVART